MNEPGWLSFYEVALEVEQSFGISRAVARKRIRQACAEQLITSMKAPYDDGGYDDGHQLPFEYWSPVAPSEWRQREVDYDGPDKNGCETVVMLRETLRSKRHCSQRSFLGSQIAVLQLIGAMLPSSQRWR